MNDYFAQRQETHELLESLYTQLRSCNGDRTRVKTIESTLSGAIRHSEEVILSAKRSADRKMEHAYRYRRSALKRIADGLAWRLFGFDDLTIRTYATGKSPGFMAGKSGYEAERFFVEVANGIPKIEYAIQNDITNCLRVGDITCLIDGMIWPFEIKSSWRQLKSNRTKRQNIRSKAIQDYLNSGIGKIHDKQAQPQRVVVAKSWPPMFNWESLSLISTRTHADSVAWEIVEDSVLLIHHEAPDDLDRIPLKKILRKVGWQKPLIMYGCLSRHFDALDNDELRFIMPITALDVYPQLVIDLMKQRVEVVVIINFDVIQKRLQDCGFKACLMENMDIEIQSTLRIKARLHMPVRWLVYCLMTVASFVELAEQVHNQVRNLYK